MTEFANATESLGPDEAASAARATIETALTHFTQTERDAFWHAIGLYYSVRRHPGANEPKGDVAEA